MKFAEPKKDKGVTTVCYGKVREWDDRSDARDFFLNAMMNSEGAERERYANIYFGIIRGRDFCTDSETD